MDKLWFEFLQEKKPNVEHPVRISKPYKEYIMWLEEKVRRLEMVVGMGKQGR